MKCAPWDWFVLLEQGLPIAGEGRCGRYSFLHSRTLVPAPRGSAGAQTCHLRGKRGQASTI